MNASLLAVLNDAERLLVAQTGPAELAALDEDAAIEFEAQVRRARNKYVGQYRRAAAAKVAEQGPAVTGEPTGDRALRSPATEKRRAGTHAAGARQQAKRDSR
jgi:hypothetical protein